MTLMMDYQFRYPEDAALRRLLELLEFTTNSSIDRQFRFGGRPTAITTHWQLLWANLTPIGHRAWLNGVLGMLAQATVILWLAVGIGAWCVHRSWRDAPASLLVQRMRGTFFSPRFRVATLRRSLSRSLTANPVGWLQHYSPAARMVKWGWCLFILFVEIFLSSNVTDLYDAQAGLGLMLLLGLAFSAAGSFRNELETGAFELLLVTPLRERQIIFGRLRGLWTQFLPALAVYGAGSIYLASGWATDLYTQNASVVLAETVSAFCILPIVGLYFSVRRLNFFVAWIFACVFGVLPGPLIRALHGDVALAFVIQLCIGLGAGLLLERRLRNRGFLIRAS